MLGPILSAQSGTLLSVASRAASLSRTVSCCLPLPTQEGDKASSEDGNGLIALCAEPGMGKSAVLSDLLLRADAAGIRSVHRAYHGQDAESVAPHLVKLARDVSRLDVPVVVVLEELPPADESCVRRMARALRKMALAGAHVVFSLVPEASQLLDALPECTVVGAEGLLVKGVAYAKRSEPCYEVNLLTRGIPSLVRSLRSPAAGSAGPREVPSAYYEALSTLVADSLRLSLTDEELRIRLGMLLLGDGSLEDLGQVAGSCALEIVASVASRAPLFGVSDTLDSFCCLHAGTVTLLSACFTQLSAACALFPAVSRESARILVGRGRFAQAAIVCRMPGACDEVDFILSQGTRFLDAGEIDLVADALGRACPDGDDACSEQGALRMAHLALTRRQEFAASLPEEAPCGRGDLEATLFVSARRVLQGRFEIPLVPADDLSPTSRRLLTHVESCRLISQGRLTSAMQCLVACDREAGCATLSGSLLRVDLELVRLMLVESPSIGDGGLGRAVEVLESSECEGLRAYVRCVELLQAFAEGDERGAASAAAVAAAAERSGDVMLRAFALIVGSLFDLQTGAFAHAGVRSRVAGSLALEAGATFVRRAAAVVEQVSRFLMGERPAMPSYVFEPVDDLAAVATLVNELMTAGGGTGCPDAVLMRGVPREALWLLLALSERLGELSTILGEEMPREWRRAVERARSNWGTERFSHFAPDRFGAVEPSGPGRSAGGGRDWSAPVEISLLGDFSVRVRGVRVPEWKLDQRNAKSVLEYLALRGGSAARRYQIVEQVWPDSDYASGFNKVYQATSVIRAAVAEIDKDIDPFVTRRASREVALNPELVACDVDVFRACAQEVTDEDDDVRVIRMARAIERIYVGDLCLPAADATGFVASVREELRGLYVDAMVSGSEAALRQGQGRTATRLAKNALSVDGEREDAMIALVRALRTCGRAAEADRQYMRYSRRIVKRDGRPPSKQLRKAMGEPVPADAPSRATGGADR